MNVRYGVLPSAPPPLPLPLDPIPPNSSACLICQYSAAHARTFPCGCVYPIHEQCIPTFRSIGGICPRCKQVWVPVILDDRSETTIIARRESKTQYICFPHDTWRARLWYSLCCILLLAGIVLCCFLLVKVYG
jgi:hypothetical protein